MHLIHWVFIVAAICLYCVQADCCGCEGSSNSCNNCCTQQNCQANNCCSQTECNQQQNCQPNNCCNQSSCSQQQNCNKTCETVSSKQEESKVNDNKNTQETTNTRSNSSTSVQSGSSSHPNVNVTTNLDISSNYTHTNVFNITVESHNVNTQTVEVRLPNGATISTEKVVEKEKNTEIEKKPVEIYPIIKEPNKEHVEKNATKCCVIITPKECSYNNTVLNCTRNVEKICSDDCQSLIVVRHPVYIDKVQSVPVPYPVRDTQYIRVPQPVQVPVFIKTPVHIPVDRPVPYPVHHNQYIPYPVEKRITVPYPVVKPVPYPVANPVPYPVVRPVPYPVANPVPYPVVRPMPYPVSMPIQQPSFVIPTAQHWNLPTPCSQNQPVGSSLIRPTVPCLQSRPIVVPNAHVPVSRPIFINPPEIKAPIHQNCPITLYRGSYVPVCSDESQARFFIGTKTRFIIDRYFGKITGGESRQCYRTSQFPYVTCSNVQNQNCGGCYHCQGQLDMTRCMNSANCTNYCRSIVAQNPIRDEIGKLLTCKVAARGSVRCS